MRFRNVLGVVQEVSGATQGYSNLRGLCKSQRHSKRHPGVFGSIPGVFKGFQGLSRGLLHGVSWAFHGVLGGPRRVPGVLQSVSGFSKGVPGDFRDFEERSRGIQVISETFH